MEQPPSLGWSEYVVDWLSTSEAKGCRMQAPSLRGLGPLGPFKQRTYTIQRFRCLIGILEGASCSFIPIAGKEAHSDSSLLVADRHAKLGGQPIERNPSQWKSAGRGPFGAHSVSLCRAN